MAEQLTDWMFRALMFEAEAEQFRVAGIRLGADLRSTEAQLLEGVLQPFALTLRNQALTMGRLYSQIYCFENAVREVVRTRLEEKHAADWWEKGVPKKVRDLAESRRQSAKDNSWLEGASSELLSFAEFGQLASIIVENWSEFSDLIPSQQWLSQRFGELEQARNFIAHNRLLLPTEFRRIEMYIEDWNKQVGL
jgi:Swt1-like HEPN